MPNNDNVYTPIQRFWRLLKPDKKEISSIYMYAVLQGLINLSVPIGIQAIVNLIQGGSVNSSWALLVVMVVVGVAMVGVFSILQLRITENLQQKIFTRAAFEFSYRIPRISAQALYQKYAPELMNRFFDITSVQKALPKIIIDFSTAGLQILFGLILLSLYHPFFIIFSLILAFIIYIIFKYTGAKGLKTSLDESNKKYEMAYWLEELARTHLSFKLAGNTSLPLKKTNALTEGYLNFREKHFVILRRQYFLLVIFKVVIAIGLLGIGGVLVMDQQMNIGQFVAAEIIIILIMGSVEKLISNLEVLYDMLTALEKIGKVTDLDLETSRADAEHVLSGPISVELNAVCFHYPGSNQSILDQINLNLPKSSVTLITGPPNSGKSSLLNVFAGLYTPVKGSLLFDNISSHSLSLETFRSKLGCCLSMGQIFAGSLFDNISLGRDGVEVSDVKWVMDAVGLQSFYNALPDGFDTALLPEGKHLSAGVRQKILLARSFVHKPQLLVIEDYLDAISRADREKIFKFLVDHNHLWTLIVGSQDLFLAQMASQIVVVQNGKVAQVGNYAEVKETTEFKTYSNA